MNRKHVCLPCLLRYGRRASVTRAARYQTVFDLSSIRWGASTPAHQRRAITSTAQSQPPFTRILRESCQTPPRRFKTSGRPTISNKPWSLTEPEMLKLRTLHHFIPRLRVAAHKISAERHLPQPPPELLLSEVLREIDIGEFLSPEISNVLAQRLQTAKYLDALPQIQDWSRHHHHEARDVENSNTKEVLVEMGVKDLSSDAEPSGSEEGNQLDEQKPNDDYVQTPISKHYSGGSSDSKTVSRSLTAADATIEPLNTGDLNVPRLSFDLSRVLFNPGVYQLQDPRSRVYNFDPYLEKIMPISEFNFDALNEYITSSRDGYLRDLALEKDKRYIGSSSSLTAALSHFHFILSSWRDINVDTLSKGFKAEGTGFTKISKSPSAIFLRWKNGVYAVDADKEFDSANILMSLGKTMEKLVTVEKDEFERYRKSDPGAREGLQSQPEQYHYAGLGKFLLRSQLDAYDPRLPGTGMFDLKTRAVVAVRHILGTPELGQGYQIKDRHGNWESYEREYHDMIRAAFLKYSLQVRMGRMDGIFVTYHNIRTIFGFQYIALPELDLALHGQTDRTLGDQEFGLSLKLLGEIFDRVTALYPQQTIRLHFDARQSEAKVREQVHRMYIFAEPMSEEEAQAIQETNNEEITALEEKMRTEVPRSALDAAADPENQVDSTDNASGAVPTKVPAREDNSANVEFLDSLEKLYSPANPNPDFSPQSSSQKSNPHSFQQTQSQSKKPVLGFELVVRNLVNGKPVVRPESLTSSDKWKVEFDLTPMPEPQAEAKYKLCKHRRRATLQEATSTDTVMSHYLKELVRMSEEGSKWRQDLADSDALKDRVILYGD